MSKMCTSHSHDLLEALRRKGMGQLVRPERAAKFAKRWLDGTATKPEFDPYVVATLEVLSKCRLMSIYVLSGGCPLCAAEKALQNSDTGRMWIDNVSDLMLLTAQVNRLVAVGA